MVRAATMSRTKAKVVLVGDSKAGKSCLLSAFAAQSFEPLYSPTVGVDFKARTVNTDDGDGKSGTIKMTLWDSAGEGQNYQAIQSTYYKGARCAIVVFDVTARASFLSADRWVAEVRKFAEGPIPIVLVATKTDLWEERQVSAQDAEDWAAEQSEVIPVLEVSAKDGTNIEDLVNSVGGVIARSGGSRGASPSPREALKVGAAAAAATQPPPQQPPPQPPTARRVAAPVVAPAATAPVTAPAALRAADQQHAQLQHAIDEQSVAVVSAAASAAEASGRVGELEAAFGGLQEKFEAVLTKIVTQQTAHGAALATLQESLGVRQSQHEAAATEMREVREGMERNVKAAAVQAEARAEEGALATARVRTQLSDLAAGVTRLTREVEAVAARNRDTVGRMDVLEAQGIRAPEVAGEQSPGMGQAEQEARLAQLAERHSLKAASVLEQRLCEEWLEMLKEGMGPLEEQVSGYESRVSGVEEELAECSLESASHLEQASEAARGTVAAGVEAAVSRSSQQLADEVRRLEAEWEARLADLATDVETAAMLGGSGSGQGDAEAEERAHRLGEELRATKASLSVAKTELELQQGEIAILTSRADNAEEDNAELRVRIDKLQEEFASMLGSLAMGASPAASPAAKVAPSRGDGDAGHWQGAGGLAPIDSPNLSLRFEADRTNTDEMEADLMGVSFNASIGGGMASPMASPMVGADLDSTRRHSPHRNLQQLAPCCLPCYQMASLTFQLATSTLAPGEVSDGLL